MNEKEQEIINEVAEFVRLAQVTLTNRIENLYVEFVKNDYGINVIYDKMLSTVKNGLKLSAYWYARKVFKKRGLDFQKYLDSLKNELGVSVSDIKNRKERIKESLDVLLSLVKQKE